MCNPQKKGVNCLLLLRLPANRRLLVVKFLVSQKLYVDIDCIEWGAVKTPKLHIFQVSTVFEFRAVWPGPSSLASVVALLLRRD